MNKDQLHRIDLKKIFLNLESLAFVASQITVGFLNYLFQIYASKTLPGIDFGLWSQWLAQFSVACFVGVWFQSLTSIGTAESLFSISKSRILFILTWLGFILSLFFHHESALYFFGWVGSLLNGFLFGVYLRKKNIRLLAFATLAGTISKFGWVFLESSSFSFYHAQAAASLIACSVFFIYPQPKRQIEPDAPFRLSSKVALASVSLAFFSSWVPQMDLLVTPKLLSQSDLGIFAKVALLNKGFFFIFQTLAQLLLAHQAQPGSPQLTSRHLLFFGLFGVFSATCGLGLASFLGWPPIWAALSLLHMTSLCLLFLCLQSFSARHKGEMALALCLLSLLLAFTGTSFGFNLESYWLFSILIEITVVIGLVRRGF